jgi:CheY-specific phosphatase CheX
MGGGGQVEGTFFFEFTKYFNKNIICDMLLGKKYNLINYLIMLCLFKKPKI